MALINNIYVLVTSESVNRDVEVSTHSVETGREFSDHIKNHGAEISIKGVIVSYDMFSAAQVLSQLQNLQVSGSLIKYSGRNLYNNLQITSFNTSHPNTVWGGCEFEMTLKEMRIAQSVFKEYEFEQGMSSAGTQQLVEAQIEEVWHKIGTLNVNDLTKQKRYFGSETMEYQNVDDYVPQYTLTKGSGVIATDNRPYRMYDTRGTNFNIDDDIPIENIYDIAAYYNGKCYPTFSTTWEKAKWILTANGVSGRDPVATTYPYKLTPDIRIYMEQGLNILVGYKAVMPK